MYRSSPGVSEIFLLVALTSLLSAAFIGVSISDSASQHRKESFLSNYNLINLERSNRGQPPLDWCSECYRFDPDWALDYPRCVDRIRRYEAGDTTALSWPDGERPGPHRSRFW